LILLDWWRDGSITTILMLPCEASQVLLAAIQGAVIGFRVMKGSLA